MQTMSILAQTANDAFFNTGVGQLVSAVLVLVGTAFVLFSIIKAFQLFASGKTGDAAKKIIVALLVGAFCFRPTMVVGIIELFANVADSIFGSDGDVSDIVNDSGILN